MQSTRNGLRTSRRARASQFINCRKGCPWRLRPLHCSREEAGPRISFCDEARGCNVKHLQGVKSFESKRACSTSERVVSHTIDSLCDHRLVMKPYPSLPLLPHLPSHKQTIISLTPTLASRIYLPSLFTVYLKFPASAQSLPINS
jgi:hypothetical protein